MHISETCELIFENIVEWSELAILGAVIGLRGAMTLLIHWEIRTEKKENL